MGPIKYQEKPYPIDDPIDDRLDIHNYDITLKMAKRGIRAIFKDEEIYPIARPIVQGRIGEPYIEDYVLSEEGPYSLVLDVLKERGLFYDLYDEDLIQSLNLDQIADLSGVNKREVAKQLPANFTVQGRFVYNLSQVVKVTWKNHVYFNLLIIALPVQSKLEFFLEYQLNQFPNGTFVYPKPFKSDEVGEVLDHAYFLDTLNAGLSKKKERFEEMGLIDIYEKTREWIKEKQSEKQGRSIIGQKLLRGETVKMDEIDELLVGFNQNDKTGNHTHLTEYFTIKKKHVYDLFDLISGHADQDLKLIRKTDEKEYIWTGFGAELSAFFAYLKEQLHIMQFSDKQEERKNLGISACMFFRFERKEPRPDSFRHDKINRDKHFSTFDQLFSNIERKINVYFGIEKLKDLNGKK